MPSSSNGVQDLRRSVHASSNSGVMTTPKSLDRIRSATESEIHHLNSLIGSVGTGGGEQDIDSPYRARLYQLFGLIEKEFDALHTENVALHNRISALTEKFGESAIALPSDVLPIAGHESSSGKGSARKAMQMGQKLRTALRGPPGRLVFKVGGGDGRNFRMVRRYAGHRDGVWHVCANEQANVLASASADQTARVFSLTTGNCLSTYLGHSGSVNCVSMSPSSFNGDCALFCSASGDESTHIWKAATSTEARVPLVGCSSDEEHPDAHEKDEAHTNENENDTPGEGVKMRTPLIRLTGHTAAVMGCEWLAGGQQIITASWDRTANIYDAERGDVINILSGHEQELNHCSAHASQKLVVTSSKDFTFRLWDFRDAIHSVAVFQGHNDSVTSVCFSSGEKIVSGSDDRTVKVWDVRNMRCALTTIRLSSSVNRLAVSQNQSVVAIPLDNGHVRIYDLNGTRLPRVPNRRCHHRMVCAVAWADDHPNSNLITTGFDRQVIGWKVAFGKEH